eukprot:CAMPEP_0172374770 /NCGR_PEP_ID=MMETSP1060-20121228/57532_1 /TAXON_ID=37318 /ORGANISM="Pseudo-nitzschia pungens, Strain cf. cingulata" /LENGTH=40 /DNA_ID= /DNA_START= /DNA_END= /DNA_ORIENTATION=
MKANLKLNPRWSLQSTASTSSPKVKYDGQNIPSSQEEPQV